MLRTWCAAAISCKRVTADVLGAVPPSPDGAVWERLRQRTSLSALRVQERVPELGYRRRALVPPCRATMSEQLQTARNGLLMSVMESLFKFQPLYQRATAMVRAPRVIPASTRFTCVTRILHFTAASDAHGT